MLEIGYKNVDDTQKIVFLKIKKKMESNLVNQIDFN
jgi:hypothetical protein